MPASRITDILDASSLSDGEIQRLIELLLEKSNANEEWEAVSGLFHMFLGCQLLLPISIIDGWVLIRMLALSSM